MAQRVTKTYSGYTVKRRGPVGMLFDLIWFILTLPFRILNGIFAVIGLLIGFTVLGVLGILVVTFLRGPS